MQEKVQKSILSLWLAITLCSFGYLLLLFLQGSLGEQMKLSTIVLLGFVVFVIILSTAIYNTVLWYKPVE